MNVLHLNRFFYSGQTTHVFSLVCEQKKQGINAFLIMDGYPSNQAMAMYKGTMNELGAAIIKPGDSTALVRHIEGKQIHLIHAHSSLTYPVANSLAEKLRIPYVVTCHGLGLNKQEYRPFFRNARFIICISPRVADTMREYAHKVYIIPNGVDLNEFKPGVKEKPVKIAFIARMDHTKQKGYNQFCKAVDLLEDVEFYVAANKNPNSQTAEYLGWTNEIAPLLSQTDIVAGTGRAILEGMAAGNAAMILGRTYQGILTPEKAAKQRFLDVSGLSGSDPCYRDIFFDLTKLLQNTNYIRQLQKFGRELVKREFDNEAHTARIIEIYNKIFD
ncbi:MAG: glycosyltransferase family 4 protein [Clostridiales bacterium]|nr:glycosyltransferase family 4 protein [Clostridiales bacterium]